MPPCARLGDHGQAGTLRRGRRLRPREDRFDAPVALSHGSPELQRQDPAVEMQFYMPDQWSRWLFVALCRRYGLKPYRYRRQRLTTVVLRVPRGFVDEVLWPEFGELNQALANYLSEVTLRVIREEVHADAS